MYWLRFSKTRFNSIKRFYEGAGTAKYDKWEKNNEKLLEAWNALTFFTLSGVSNRSKILSEDVKMLSFESPQLGQSHYRKTKCDWNLFIDVRKAYALSLQINVGPFIVHILFPWRKLWKPSSIAAYIPRNERALIEQE